MIKRRLLFGLGLVLGVALCFALPPLAPVVALGIVLAVLASSADAEPLPAPLTRRPRPRREPFARRHQAVRRQRLPRGAEQAYLNRTHHRRAHV